MANAPDLSIQLQAVGDEPRHLSELLTTFPLAAVIVDPFTHESSWLLDTARRILTVFREADVRVAFVVAGTDSDGASRFLGPLTDEILTLADPDRSLARSMESWPSFPPSWLSARTVRSSVPPKVGIRSPGVRRQPAWLI
ncbi:MAG: hypothetical protein Ct9H300mP31_08890 [Acidimicrobiaceae bacterium]|nr:MAG: hypothetical protein Ct9H300mP31_08890 [Acidimicrobiaceae bacterium]